MNNIQNDVLFIDVPIYSIKIDQSQSLKEPSKICQHHIVLVENPDSLSKLSIKSLSGLGGTGKFALVFGEKISLNQMEVILLQNKDFANIIEIALFVPKGGNSFSVITRSLENDKELAVLNIWNNGEYRWNTSVYPKGRLNNLKGVAIKATSFNYPPTCYKENPENEDEEYQGIEVRILKDISASLNFTYKIRNPTDGKRWGQAFPNGSATGLLNDVKVFLNIFFYIFFFLMV